MNEYFEIEKKLIDAYRLVQKSLWELELINNHNPSVLSTDDREKLEIRRIEKEELAVQLTSLDQTPLTQKKAIILSNQIQQIVDKLTENEYGLKLSRNQGLIHETAIFIFVIRDIEWALDLDILMTSIPHYFYASDSDFDHIPLRNALLEFKEAIKTEKPSNYIELESLVHSFLDRIQEIANNEYDALMKK